MTKLGKIEEKYQNQVSLKENGIKRLRGRGCVCVCMWKEQEILY